MLSNFSIIKHIGDSYSFILSLLNNSIKKFCPYSIVSYHKRFDQKQFMMLESYYYYCESF